jgi:hypothetical protein
MQTFSAEVSDWVAKTEARQMAVFKQSAQAVAETLTNTAPVDTGFLRAGLQLAINQSLPSASQHHPGGNSFSLPAGYAATISNAKIGDYITLGYVANYAVFLEYGTAKIAPRGWVRAAAMQWPQIVSRVSSQAFKAAS